MKQVMQARKDLPAASGLEGKAPLVSSLLELSGADGARVRRLVENLKRIEDLPHEKYEMREVGRGRLELEIWYPLSVFDGSVAQFLSVLFGELSFMRDLGRLRFVDLKLPGEVCGWFGGPEFGADGVMRRFGVSEAPMLVGIVKPSLGLSTGVIEKKVRAALRGGIHAVKDDEMQGDFAGASLRARVRLAEKCPAYVPALNLDSAREYEEILKNEKIGMVLVNGSALGFPMLHEMGKIARVPVLSHLAMQGAYASSFSPRVFALLHRLFGCDALITPIGDTGYYRASKGDELEMAKALTEEMPIKRTLPLLTGGARLANLEGVISPYEETGVGYGVVFGTQIFAQGGNPAERARQIAEKIAGLK